MKKNIFLFLVLAIIAVSCQKDIVSNDAHFMGTSQIKSAFDSQTFAKQTDESKADEQRIVEFSNLLNELKNTSSASPTGNEMAVDATVWNVEALLNASYASAGEPFARSSVKRDSISVPLNANGAIDESSLPAVYQAIKSKLGEQYQGVIGANKHLVFVDIELKRVRSSTSFANPTPMADFGITSLTGYDLPEGMPFGAGDDWKWDAVSGKCNPTTGAATGSNLGEGSATRLTTQLNIRYPKPDSRYYYLNIQSKNTEYDYIKPRTPGDSNILDNVRDYLIYQISSEFPLLNPGLDFDKFACINSDDMNWYYQNYFDRITQFKNTLNKDFVSIVVRPDAHLHTDPVTLVQHDVLFHVLEITYGNYHRNYCTVICSCTDDSCLPSPSCFYSTN
jgi:hypothetical protein